MMRSDYHTSTVVRLKPDTTTCLVRLTASAKASARQEAGHYDERIKKS